MLASYTVPAADNATITGDGVRLRGEPNTDAAVIGTLSKGARVEIVFRTGTMQTIDGSSSYWYFTNAGDNGGYIFGRFIAIDPAVAPSFSPDAAPSGLKLPFEDWGACPFECCVYREWSVRKETVVRSDRYDAAPSAFTLKPGEWVTGITGVVITTVPGRAEVRRPATVGGRAAVPGDVVWLLTNQVEGFYKAWFKGEFIDGFNGYHDIVLTTQPVFAWWVKVQDKSGRIGWSKEYLNFGHMDGCGGD